MRLCSHDADNKKTGNIRHSDYTFTTQIIKRCEIYVYETSIPYETDYRKMCDIRQ